MIRRGEFIDSFRYAAQGFWAAVREERNMRFHLCAAFYAVSYTHLDVYKRQIPAL